jgi:hypothetical protein
MGGAEGEVRVAADERAFLGVGQRRVFRVEHDGGRGDHELRLFASPLSTQPRDWQDVRFDRRPALRLRIHIRDKSVPFLLFERERGEREEVQ